MSPTSYKEKKFIVYSASTFCLFFLTSCRVPEDWTRQFNDHVGPVFGVRLEYTDGKPQPTAGTKVNPEAHLSLNAEFLKEAYKVVLERNCTEEEFHRWMNVLDQGGSYEGIYNGLAHNEEYRSKEKGAALPEALRLYAQLMAQLALDMKYDPLKIKTAPDEPIPGQRPEEAAPQGKPTDAEKNQLISEMATKGVNKSLYTLKREAAAEALKVMEYKKEYKEKYATWFGRFAQWSNARKVDFGIDARNKNDEYFHYKWALDSTEDRIRWEVLNRVHRIFNAVQTK